MMTLVTRLSTLALASALSAPAAMTADFHVTRVLAPGHTIEIKGVNGSIDATAASGTEVDVSAVKRARRSDPASVEIQVVEHDGNLTVCAVYPSPAGSPNECLPGEAGRMNTRDNDVTVDFTVRVPAGVRFVGRSVNGSIDAKAMPADAEAYTVNGGVTISAAGIALAETVNGGITASLGKADGVAPLRFQTVNGSIRVSLPAGANADLKAETVNGEITTDFPVTVQGRLSKKRLTAKLGSGGRELHLETVNGSIRLVSSSS